MINISLIEFQWNSDPIATHELMAEVDADLGNVVVAGEDERSHEIVAAVASGLEARNLENMSLFHPNSLSQSFIAIPVSSLIQICTFSRHVTLKNETAT